VESLRCFLDLMANPLIVQGSSRNTSVSLEHSTTNNEQKSVQTTVQPGSKMTPPPKVQQPVKGLPLGKSTGVDKLEQQMVKKHAWAVSLRRKCPKID